MSLIDKKFREKWKNYLWQSMAAGISIAIVLSLLTSTVSLVIKATVGATAFTVFAIPSHSTARARNVIGGQTFGTIVGLACSFVPFLPVQGGLAIAFATFLMVTLNTEHPPAAGTALGMALTPSIEAGIFVLLAALILSGIRRLLKDHLRDLT